MRLTAWANANETNKCIANVWGLGHCANKYSGTFYIYFQVFIIRAGHCFDSAEKIQGGQNSLDGPERVHGK